MVASTVYRKHACLECGRRWTARDVLRLWPIGLRLRNPFKRYHGPFLRLRLAGGWETGHDNYGNRLLSSALLLGPLAVVFGPERYLPRATIMRCPYCGVGWLERPASQPSSKR